MSLRALSPWARLSCAALVFALAGCPDPVVVPDAPITPDAGDAGPRDGGPRDGGMPDGGGPVCGDGVVNGTEVCDDSNTAANDGCSATCTEEAGWTCDGADPTVCTEDCGDGMVVGDEAGANGCDDGNAATGDGCATCMVEMGWACAGAPSVCTANCGDGAINGSEVCDDGDNMDNDGCSMACQVETGWTCDTAEPTVCTSTCGDGLIAMGAETCDDSNMAAGDGCSDLCAIETGWDCSTGTCAPICGDMMTIAPETCDDGNAVSEECAYGLTSCDICDSTCRTSPGATRYCGDTNVDPEEACDDGNTTAADGCSAVCVVEAGYDCSSGTCAPICGDNMTVGTETCDDGNTMSGDGCDATCQVESVCGDGTIEGLETCDDSNTAAGDGCSAACLIEAGFTCYGTGPSFCGATCAAAETTVLGCGSTITADTTGAPANITAYTTCTTSTSYAGGERVFVFRNTTGMAQDVRVVSAAITATGDYDLFVLGRDPAETCGTARSCIDGSRLGGAGETVDFTARTATPYYVVFDPFSTGTTPGTFSLTVTCAATVCGDGTKTATEGCDDGNIVSGDGCSSTCAVELGSTCTTASPSVCTRSCGNGTILTANGQETCDDGNSASGDGCSSTCGIETGFVCAGTPSVCRPRVCGDGFRDAPEACDDGNTTAADGCSATCAVEADFSCTTATPNVCTANAYLTTTITAACVDMTAGAAQSIIADDAVTTSAALPFAFTYFGAAATNWVMSSNGNLQLIAGAGSDQWTNTALPSASNPNGTIAAFWDDLLVTTTPGTPLARVLTTGTGPNRVFVAEWANVRPAGALAGEGLTFQAMLYETTNVIELHYCSITGASTALTGASASIGLENATGTVGVQRSLDTAGAIAAGRAFRFTPR